MYFAVYKFGPRWEQRVERVPGRNFDGTPTMVERWVTVDLQPAAYDVRAAEAARTTIFRTDPSLQEIERLADAG